MKTAYILIAWMTCLASCATPVRQTNQPMSTYDKDTEYRIDSTSDGFTVSIYYSRYQFVPESEAVAVACKSALTSIAFEHADKIGRPIETINEQRIRLSMGRNGLTGMTSCSASAPARFK